MQVKKNRYTNQATTIEEEEEKIATLIGHGLPHIHTVLAIFFLFICVFLWFFCVCFLAFFLKNILTFSSEHLMTMQVKNITLGKEF